MNIFTCILLACAVIAFIDKVTGQKLGLGESIDLGMSTMGSTTIAVLGASSVGIAFMNQHAESAAALSDILPFDPSMLMGICLCPETGAFALTKQLTDNPDLVILNGIVLAGLLGQVISFQFPVFLSTLPKQHHRIVIIGFIVGLIMIPIGLMIAAFMLKLSPASFITEFIPIFIICLILSFGMIKAQKRTVAVVSGFAKVIQILIHLLLILAVVGVFIPSLAYADLTLVNNAMIVILQCTIIICGALALSNTFIKIFRKQLQWIASKIGVNEVSVVAFVLNCINSLAILPLYHKMDEKGKMMNAAFSVSGAYFLGGQMGFVVSAAESGYFLSIYLVTKGVCGFASLVVAGKLYSKFGKEQKV